MFDRKRCESFLKALVAKHPEDRLNALRDTLRELCYAGVLAGIKPNDVYNAIWGMATYELGVELEWSTESTAVVTSMVLSELAGHNQ